jgi:hypothetical protein
MKKNPIVEEEVMSSTQYSGNPVFSRRGVRFRGESSVLSEEFDGKKGGTIYS